MPKLFYLWGHSYEFKDNWDRLDAVCEALGARENVWYATNGEVIDYLDAYRSLRRSANGKYIYNPTDKDVYVWTEKHGDVLLEKGKTTVIGE